MHHQKLKCTLCVREGKKEEEASYKYKHKTCRRLVCKYEGMLISPWPDLLPDVVGRER